MATFPFERARPLGWAYGEILTSAQQNIVDDNAASAADGAIWTDVTIVKNWPYRKDFSALLAGSNGVTAAVWDSYRTRWTVFTYDGSNNPDGEYAQSGTGLHHESNNWVSLTIPAGATLQPLCAATDGAGVVVIGGATTGSSASKIRETSDGDTYAARSVTTTGTTGVRALIYHSGASKFIAGLDNAAATNIETSADGGQTWVQITGLPNSHARGSFASNGTTLVCTAYNTSTNKCITSTTGATWTEQTLPSTEKWAGVVYDEHYEQFIAIGETNIAYSSDGATWLSAGAHGISFTASASRVVIIGRVFAFIDGDDVVAGHVVDGTITVRRVLKVTGTSCNVIAAGDNQLMAGDASELVYWTLCGGTL